MHAKSIALTYTREVRLSSGTAALSLSDTLPSILYLDQPHLKILFVLVDHRLKYESGEERQDAGDGCESADDEGRIIGNETRLDKGYKDRDEEPYRQCHQDKGHYPEVCHRFICSEQLCNGAEDLESVRVCVELGFAALGPVAVLDYHVLHGHVLVDGVNAHLRLDLKTSGQNRERLDELEAEGSVACHDVFYVALKQSVDECPDHAVAEIVERPLVLFKVSGRQSVTDDHVDLTVEDFGYHLGGELRRVRVVSVDHQITLRVDLAEHAADDIAFALLVFISDDGAGILCDLGRAVCGVVVVDVDYTSRGENRSEVFDYFRYGL